MQLTKLFISSLTISVISAAAVSRDTNQEASALVKRSRQGVWEPFYIHFISSLTFFFLEVHLRGQVLHLGKKLYMHDWICKT